MIENCIFKFAGVRSDDMGVIVEKVPNYSFAKRKQSIYSVHGRTGNLIVDENAYENTKTQYKIYAYDGTNIKDKARAIKKWLLCHSGYENLSDNTDNFETYRKARFVGGGDFENRFAVLGRATITFDCCPQYYPTTDEVLTGTIGNTITLPTHADMQKGLPLISIPTLMIGTAFEIITDFIYITVPAQSITKNSVFIDWENHNVGTLQYNRTVDNVTISGTWDALGDGDTIQTVLTDGNAAAFTVNTRRWYI